MNGGGLAYNLKIRKGLHWLCAFFAVCLKFIVIFDKLEDRNEDAKVAGDISQIIFSTLTARFIKFMCLSHVFVRLSFGTTIK